jgi:hypothetical protein
MEIVYPSEIEEENDIRLAVFHASGQSWQVRPCPIIDNRMDNDVFLRGGNTSFFAQDMHNKSCLGQMFTQVKRMVCFRSRIRREWRDD